MKIGKVIGTVTLSRPHEQFEAAALKLVVPYTLAELAGGSEPQGESLVAWDALGVGPGQRVCFSEGAEAAQPFRPESKAVDAYITAILDDVNLSRSAVESILKTS